MQNFAARHALSCPNVDIVIAHKNGIREEIIHILRQAFYPNCVRVKTLTHLVHSRSEEEVRQGGSVLETRGDVSIRGLWESQT